MVLTLLGLSPFGSSSHRAKGGMVEVMVGVIAVGGASLPNSLTAPTPDRIPVLLAFPLVLVPGGTFSLIFPFDIFSFGADELLLVCLRLKDILRRGMTHRLQTAEICICSVPAIRRENLNHITVNKHGHHQRLQLQCTVAFISVYLANFCHS